MLARTNARAWLVLLIAVMAATASPARAEEPGRWDLVLDVPSDRVAAVTFATNRVAWAAGDGAIFRSEDGGQSWDVARTSRGFLADIEAAPGGEHGWAVGLWGQLFTTADGGRTWTDRSADTQVNLQYVEAIDADTLLAAGTGEGISDSPTFPEASTFRRSTDGGQTWMEISLGGYDVRALDALSDGAHAWAAGRRCVPAPPGGGCLASEYALFQSDDGGNTWKHLNTGRSIVQLHFITAQNGWAIERRCPDPIGAESCSIAITRTEDGGKLWHEVHAARTAGGARLWAFDEQRAVAALEICEARCLTDTVRSDDGGLTWSTVESGTEGSVYDLAYADASHGLRATYDDVSWTDDGTTWHAGTFPISVGTGAFDFVDADTGWFAASKLLRTDDAGAHFTPVSDAPPPDVIDFVSKTEGWGTDLVCDPACSSRVDILHTRDGGRSWEIQHTATLGNYLELSMHDERHGWAHAISDRLLLRTSDGGRTWTEIALPKTARESDHTAIAFAAEATVWFAETSCAARWESCSSNVWRSIDSGGNWTPVAPIPIEEPCPLGIASVDAKTAWITTYRCRDRMEAVLFRTTNSGQSWQRGELDGVGEVGQLTFFDRLNGRGIRAICPDVVIDPCGQVVMRTSDGGASWHYETIPPIDLEGSARYQFATPERTWRLSEGGGGLVNVWGQKLYRYTGTGKITLPDTGDDQPPSRPRGRVMLTALLIVVGIAAIGAGRAARRRRP